MEKPELFSEEEVEKVASRFMFIGTLVGAAGATIIFLVLLWGR